MSNILRRAISDARSHERALLDGPPHERLCEQETESRSPIVHHRPGALSYMMLLVLIPLPGCGSESPPPDAKAASEASASVATQGADRTEACSLLTAAEVETAVGEAMREGTLEEKGTGPDESYFSMCTFTPVSDTSTTAVTLTVRPSPGVTDPAAALEAQVADMRENAIPDYQLEPIEELGSGAGWDAGMHQVTVFRPGLMLIVSVNGRLEEARQAAVDLAKMALDRTE